MQKVVGSSPIIRSLSLERPGDRASFVVQVVLEHMCAVIPRGAA
jgi:hypothetical protein